MNECLFFIYLEKNFLNCSVVANYHAKSLLHILVFKPTTYVMNESKSDLSSYRLYSSYNGKYGVNELNHH